MTTKTQQNLSALNAFRIADGKKEITKWKSDRHLPQLEAYRKEARKGQPRVSMAHAPSDEPKALRAGTNQAILAIAMVKGVTMEQAVRLVNEARARKDITLSPLDKAVIGATMSYDLTKVKGYGVRSDIVDGVPTYFLVLPAGLDAPIIK